MYLHTYIRRTLNNDFPRHISAYVKRLKLYMHKDTYLFSSCIDFQSLTQYKYSVIAVMSAVHRLRLKQPVTLVILETFALQNDFKDGER